VPGVPVRTGVRDGELVVILRNRPWQPLTERDEVPQPGLRMVIDTDDPDAEVRYDHPLSFRHGARQFTLRYVEHQWISKEELNRGEPLCISPA